MGNQECNVIDVFRDLERQYSPEQTATLEKDSEFEGWDKVHQEIADETNKILDGAFDKVSKQIAKGAERQIEKLTDRRKELEEDLNKHREQMTNEELPESLIEETEAPTWEYIDGLDIDIAGWQAIKSHSAKCQRSKERHANKEKREKENQEKDEKKKKKKK